MGNIPSADIDASFALVYPGDEAGTVHVDVKTTDTQVLDAWQRPFIIQIPRKGTDYNYDYARLVSAGTALHLINEQPDDAINVLQGSDLFFMNEEEAVRLFGSMDAVNSRPGQTIFVTKGRAGATVIQGDVATHLSGGSASVVDPTGAGGGHDVHWTQSSGALHGADGDRIPHCTAWAGEGECLRCCRTRGGEPRQLGAGVGDSPGHVGRTRFRTPAR